MINTKDDESSILMIDRFTLRPNILTCVYSALGILPWNYRVYVGIRLWTDFAILANVLY